MGLVWAILKPVLVSAGCGAVVYFIIDFIFPDGKVPKIISKIRWVIAIMVMITIIIISALIKANMTITPMVAGFAAITIASLLKQNDENKN